MCNRRGAHRTRILREVQQCWLMVWGWKINTEEEVFYFCASYSVKLIITSSLIYVSNFKNGDFNAGGKQFSAAVAPLFLNIVDHNRCGCILIDSWTWGLLPGNCFLGNNLFHRGIYFLGGTLLLFYTSIHLLAAFRINSPSTPCFRAFGLDCRLRIIKS